MSENFFGPGEKRIDTDPNTSGPNPEWARRDPNWPNEQSDEIQEPVESEKKEKIEEWDIPPDQGK